MMLQNMTMCTGWNLCRHSESAMSSVRVQLSIRELVLSRTMELLNSTMEYTVAVVNNIPRAMPMWPVCKDLGISVQSP